MWDLAPCLGIEPRPPALGAQSLSHWTTREVPSCEILSDSLQPHGLQPAWPLCPWDFPGKNTRVGCHFLSQGIFLNQGSNLCLLHWQVDSLPLSHQFSSVQSVTQSCPTLCDPMNRSMPGLPVHHQLPIREARYWECGRATRPTSRIICHCHLGFQQNFSVYTCGVISSPEP